MVIRVGLRRGRATRHLLRRVINQLESPGRLGSVIDRLRAPPKSIRVLFSPDDTAHLLDPIGQAYLLFFIQPASWN